MNVTRLDIWRSEGADALKRCMDRGCGAPWPPTGKNPKWTNKSLAHAIGTPENTFNKWSDKTNAPPQVSLEFLIGLFSRKQADPSSYLKGDELIRWRVRAALLESAQTKARTEFEAMCQRLSECAARPAKPARSASVERDHSSAGSPNSNAKDPQHQTDTDILRSEEVIAGLLSARPGLTAAFERQVGGSAQGSTEGDRARAMAARLLGRWGDPRLSTKVALRHARAVSGPYWRDPAGRRTLAALKLISDELARHIVEPAQVSALKAAFSKRPSGFVDVPAVDTTDCELVVARVEGRALKYAPYAGSERVSVNQIDHPEPDTPDFLQSFKAKVDDSIVGKVLTSNQKTKRSDVLKRTLAKSNVMGRDEAIDGDLYLIENSEIHDREGSIYEQAISALAAEWERIKFLRPSRDDDLIIERNEVLGNVLDMFSDVETER